MWHSIAIIACFLLGLLLGRNDVWPSDLDADSVCTALLYLLLFAIGFTAASDERTRSAIRSIDATILAAPVSAVVGSFVGAAAYGLMTSEWSVREAVAVGFGLGYYSLSSVLIEQRHGSDLAVIALMSNVFREVGTIVLARPMRVVFGPLAPVASGGATASDTTLPSILAASGREYVFPAVFTGIGLSFLVPILVTLALGT